MQRLSLSIAFALCVVGAAFGTYTLARESIVLDRYEHDSVEEYERIASGQARVGLSSFAKRQVLASCHYGLTSELALVRPAEEIERFAVACRNYSQAVAASMPTNSYAWLVLANASRALGDMPSMNRSLELSQLSGPNEQWLAERRVVLAEDNFDELSDAAKTGNARDLAMLATSYRGVKTIAKRYVTDEAFRNRITTIVSGLPADIQRRFLSSVKRAAQEATP
jgi:hypothetical protein